jgi:hypothetical protein
MFAANDANGKKAFNLEPLEGRALLSTTGMTASPSTGEPPRVAAVVASATVLPATTTGLAASSSTTLFGQSVTLTATIKRVSGAGVPTGVVTFKSNGVAIGTGALNTLGVATLSTSKLAVGADKVTASYGGSSAYAASTSATLAHTVVAGSSKTTLASSALTANLGQLVTFTAGVTAVAPSSGVPTGTVRFLDGTTIIGTASLDKNGRASLTISNFFLGTHRITATFLGSTQFKTSAAPAISQIVNQGPMTTLADGLKVATTVAGSGPGAVARQTLKVNYTGYLTNGTKFDSSLNAGRTPFDFQLGAGQVIKGWDEGMAGAKVGEQRVLIIPPSLGYGATAQGSIPANSTLIFIVRVVAFDTNPQLVVQGGAGQTVAITNNQTPTAANGTNFGSVKVGASGSSVTFAISNAGNAPLAFTGNPFVQISGVNPGDFVLSQPVISGNKALFTITFKPKALGSRTARITIPTNDPKFPAFAFSITGTGI